MDGGSLMNQGIHYVDLLRWCMGPVAEVTAVCATQTHQIEVEDTSLAALRFSSGAVGTIVASTSVFPGFAQRLEITGTEGTITIEDGAIIRRAFGRGAHEPPRRAAGGGRVGVGGTGVQPGRRGRRQPRRAARGPAGRDRDGARARGHRRERPGRARGRLRRLRVGAHGPHPVTLAP